MRTDPARCGEPVLLEDRTGRVAVYPLPYLEPGARRGRRWGCPPARGHEQALTAAMAPVRADLAARPGGTRSVVLAHAFVAGGQASDSERDISVGGVGGGARRASSTGVDYVALGHLHGRQQLARGGPLLRVAAGVLLLRGRRTSRGPGWSSSGRGGLERIDAVDAPVPRPLAVLRGAARRPAVATRRSRARRRRGARSPSPTTSGPAEAMDRLRARFPHALELPVRAGRAASAAGTYTRRVAEQDDLGLCCGFLEHVRRRAPRDDETAVLRAAIEGARVGLARESGVAPLRAGRRLVPAASPVHVPAAGESSPELADELAAG